VTGRVTDKAASSLERKRPSDRRIDADANQLSHFFSPVKATSPPIVQATKWLLFAREGDDAIEFSRLMTKRETKRRHLLKESDEPSDKATSYLGRIRQTDRQSSFFSLMKERKSKRQLSTESDKATDTQLLLSSEDGKPTNRATDKIASSLERRRRRSDRLSKRNSN
jgi:hypothetical protein